MSYDCPSLIQPPPLLPNGSTWAVESSVFSNASITSACCAAGGRGLVSNHYYRRMISIPVIDYCKSSFSVSVSSCTCLGWCVWACFRACFSKQLFLAVTHDRKGSLCVSCVAWNGSLFKHEYKGQPYEEFGVRRCFFHCQLLVSNWRRIAAPVTTSG